MRQPWFKRFGWFRVPISAAGVLVFIAALAFCVNVFLAVDRHSHSVSDTLNRSVPAMCLILAAASRLIPERGTARR